MHSAWAGRVSLKLDKLIGAEKWQKAESRKAAGGGGRRRGNEVGRGGKILSVTLGGGE